VDVICRNGLVNIINLILLFIMELNVFLDPYPSKTVNKHGLFMGLLL